MAKDTKTRIRSTDVNIDPVDPFMPEVSNYTPWDPTEGWETDEMGDLWEPGTEGDLDYSKLHPPNASIENWAENTTSLHGSIIGKDFSTATVDDVGQFYADLLGDDSWNPLLEVQDLDPDDPESQGDQRTFSDVFGPGMEREIRDWQSDWGPDLFGQGSGDDWKQHGADRALDVDLEYMVDVESYFKDTEVALGINKPGLISNTYPGYGSGGIDTSLLEAYIGSPDEAIDNLYNMSTASIGASGTYAKNVKQINETFTKDKKQAKEDLDLDISDIKDERKQRGNTLRGQFSTGGGKLGMGGLKRGGSGLGRGRSRKELVASRNEMKGLNIKREAARKSYADSWKSGGTEEQEKEYDLTTEETTLKNKTEAELRTLKSDIVARDTKFDLQSKKLEEDRYDDILDSLATIAGTDTSGLFPTAGGN